MQKQWSDTAKDAHTFTVYKEFQNDELHMLSNIQDYLLNYTYY